MHPAQGVLVRHPLELAGVVGEHGPHDRQRILRTVGRQGGGLEHLLALARPGRGDRRVQQPQQRVAAQHRAPRQARRRVPEPLRHPPLPQRGQRRLVHQVRALLAGPQQVDHRQPALVRAGVVRHVERVAHHVAVLRLPAHPRLGVVELLPRAARQPGYPP